MSPKYFADTPPWGTRFLQAKAANAVRVQRFGAIYGTFARRAAEGSSGGGVGGEVNLLPQQRVLNTPTRGSTDFGINLDPFWDHFGINRSHLEVILKSFGLHSGIILESFGCHLGVIWSPNSDYTDPLGVETYAEIEFFNHGS